MSKYCMGISYLYPEAKSNLFKPLKRKIESISDIEFKDIEIG